MEWKHKTVTDSTISFYSAILIILNINNKDTVDKK